MKETPPMTAPDALSRLAALAPSRLTAPEPVDLTDVMLRLTALGVAHPDDVEPMAVAAANRRDWTRAAKLYDLIADCWQVANKSIREAVARGLAQNCRKWARGNWPVIVADAETYPCITCESPVEKQGNQCISCAISEAHTSTAWAGDEMCEECGREPHEAASYLCYRCSEVARIERVAD